MHTVFIVCKVHFIKNFEHSDVVCKNMQSTSKKGNFGIIGGVTFFWTFNGLFLNTETFKSSVCTHYFIQIKLLLKNKSNKFCIFVIASYWKFSLCIWVMPKTSSGCLWVLRFYSFVMRWFLHNFLINTHEVLVNVRTVIYIEFVHVQSHCKFFLFLMSICL